MILSRLLQTLSTYRREVFQILILIVAVLVYKHFSEPVIVEKVITKVEIKTEQVIQYVDRIVYKEVEKVVYKDRTTTKTITRPSGVTTTTVTVDRGTTEMIEKDLVAEESTTQTEVKQVNVSEHKVTTSPALSRWSLAVNYDLRSVNKFVAESLGVEGGIRIANMPVWLIAGVGELGRSYRAGIRFEF